MMPTNTEKAIAAREAQTRKNAKALAVKRTRSARAVVTESKAIEKAAKDAVQE
jgi:hypothetical protein